MVHDLKNWLSHIWSFSFCCFCLQCPIKCRLLLHQSCFLVPFLVLNWFVFLPSLLLVFFFYISAFEIAFLKLPFLSLPNVYFLHLPMWGLSLLTPCSVSCLCEDNTHLCLYASLFMYVNNANFCMCMCIYIYRCSAL